MDINNDGVIVMGKMYVSGETFTNDETGEKYINFFRQQRVQFPKGTDFMNFFNNFFVYLAETGLTPTETRVLFRMLSYAEFENWIRVGQAQLAEDLQLKKQNIQRAVKTLLEKEVILIQPSIQDRRRNDYRFNPCYGWKGSAKSWRAWLEEAGKQDRIKSPAYNNNVVPMREAAEPRVQKG